MIKMFEASLQLMRIGDLNEREVKEIIQSFLSNQDTDYIDSHRCIVAQTYEVLLEQIQGIYKDIDSIPRSVLDDIMRIFANIEHIPVSSTKEEKTDGSICLLKFLSFLKQHNSIEGDGDFTNLNEIREILDIIAEDLEKIRFVFDHKISGELMFPIDKLLVGIINNSLFLTQNRGVDRKDYYALKLAVRFFKKDTEGDRIVAEIRKDSNLKFIDYLNQDSRLIDTSDMLNYQKNGIMVFWNSSTKKVLVRSDHESYFAKDLGYHFDIEREMTKDQKVQIGSFVEISCQETDKAVNVSDLMKTLDKRKEVVKLFFTEGRNIFLPWAVRESKDGCLHAMNPFMDRDEYIIKTGNYYLSTDIKNAFREYSNLTLIQSHSTILNRVCIGTLAMLTELNDESWYSLLEPYEENDFYQNQMIQRWMEQTEQNTIDKMLLNYYHELRYCDCDSDLMKIREHEISKQYIYPLKNNVCALLNFIIPQIYKEIDIVYGLISEGTDGRTVIIQGTGETKTTEKIHDPENILEGLESSSAYFIYCDELLYVIEQEEAKALYGLKNAFKNCLAFDVATIVSAGRYDNISMACSLHRMSLMEESRHVYPIGDEYFEDQVFYRFIHNMIGYGINKKNIEAYLKVFESHQLLTFQKINEDSYFKMEEAGNLYVPKDAYSADAALSMVYDEYLRKYSTRNKNNLYDDRLDRINGGFYRNGHKIKKVTILLDNFENGGAAINCISAYLEIDLGDGRAKKVEDAKKRIQRYYFDDENRQVEAKLQEILKSNECKIEIHAYYGTDRGRENIESFLNKYNIPHEPTTYTNCICPTIGAIKNEALMIWPNSELVKDDTYAVIREFNLTKRNVFPNEMITNAKKAITLFIKKEERSIPTGSQNDVVLYQQIEYVVNYIAPDMMKENKDISDKLKTLSAENNIQSLIYLGEILNKRKLKKCDNDVISATIDLGILAFVKYFKEKNVEKDKRANSALTIFSTLPPHIRIAVWEKIIEEDHSFIILDKLIKSYAKNDQMETVESNIKKWIEAGYINAEEGLMLKRQAELLYNHKSMLPIAEDIYTAKKNYEALMKTMNREDDTDQEFITVMDMICG